MSKSIKAVLFTLALVCICGFFSTSEAKAASPYLIKINKQQCVVTVYKQNKKGKYTKPVKAFVCSPGNATPTGTFPLKEKMRWHTLDGPTYGQFCSRITGGVLFHSVWYYKQTPNALSYTQYNRLGTLASHGCVRLCVQDAKWIYDNCPSGTNVTIYNSKNPGPLGKPKAIKLKGYTGWDPTDKWNSGNPYAKKKPTITGAKSSNITFGSTFKIKKGIKVKNTTGFNSIKLLKTKIWFKEKGSSYKRVKKVNTKRAGVYKIQYKITDEIGRKASVTVKHKVLTRVSVTKIHLSATSKTLYLGSTSSAATTKVTVKSVLPKKASIKKVKVSVSNKSVATINSKGKVTAKKAGTCYITFTARDGSGTKAVCKITVKQRATGLTLRAASNRLEAGASMNVTATVSPADTSNKAIAYSSSNTSIATVNASGVVTGKQAGTVVITAKTTDGSNKVATVTLTIFHKINSVQTPTIESIKEVSQGVELTTVISELPQTVTVKDKAGNSQTASVTWTCSSYNKIVVGDYPLVGKINTPAGWEGSASPINVTIRVIEALLS